MSQPVSGQYSYFIPLKTPENQRYSGVFRGYKIGILARNGLKCHLCLQCLYKSRRQMATLNFLFK